MQSPRAENAPLRHGLPAGRPEGFAAYSAAERSAAPAASNASGSSPASNAATSSRCGRTACAIAARVGGSHARKSAPAWQAAAPAAAAERPRAWPPSTMAEPAVPIRGQDQRAHQQPPPGAPGSPRPPSAASAPAAPTRQARAIPSSSSARGLSQRRRLPPASRTAGAGPSDPSSNSAPNMRSSGSTAASSAQTQVIPGASRPQRLGRRPYRQREQAARQQEEQHRRQGIRAMTERKPQFTPKQAREDPHGWTS